MQIINYLPLQMTISLMYKKKSLVLIMSYFQFQFQTVSEKQKMVTKTFFTQEMTNIS